MVVNMMSGKEIGLITGSYFLGCLATGYYWVRWQTGQDIRFPGSARTFGWSSISP